MGLDMYLTKKIYIGAEYDFRNVKGKIDITIDNKKVPINFNKVKEIEESVAYWRKANAIHKYFVDNVQYGNDNCREYYVSRNTLKDLLEKCKEVMDKAILVEGEIKNGETLKDGKWQPIMEKGKYIINAEEIASILPTADGFFFGSTDYDEYYLEDIKYTIEVLTQALKEDEELEKQGFWNSFCYKSSW